MNMMLTRRFSITSCAVVFAVCLFGDARAFAAEDDVRMFAVTSQSDSGGQVAATRELLAIGSDSGKSFVRISNGSASASFAADMASDGEISTQNPDAAVICYNMAASVVAAYDKNPKGAVPLYMRFLDQIVPVPLTIHTQEDSNGTSLLSFKGRSVGTIANDQNSVPSGLFVEGQIAEQRGSVESATFSEVTLVGVPAQRMSGTNCSLSEVAPTLGA
jgi:hypothetical protein